MQLEIRSQARHQKVTLLIAPPAAIGVVLPTLKEIGEVEFWKLRVIFSSKSTRSVCTSVCDSVRLRVNEPIAEHSMGVPAL